MNILKESFCIVTTSTKELLENKEHKLSFFQEILPRDLKDAGENS
jgi:hypothetical protein